MANKNIAGMTPVTAAGTMSVPGYDPANPNNDISLLASDIANTGAIEAGAHAVGSNGTIFVPITLVGASFTSSTNSATLTVVGTSNAYLLAMAALSAGAELGAL